MVLTPAVIDSPFIPYPGWQQRDVGVQTYMNSQSIGPTRYLLLTNTHPGWQKTRCVLLKPSVFTRKIIDPPRKCCAVLAVKKIIDCAKVHCFHNQIGPTRIRRLLMAYPGTQKIDGRCQSRVFPNRIGYRGASGLS